MALLDDWLNGDLFSILRDKVNAIVAAVNIFGGGTTGQIWTKDSNSDFDGSFKDAEDVVLSGLPSLTGNANKVLKVNNAETAIELYSAIAEFESIPITGASYSTISSTAYATLSDGAGADLEVTLPNDSVSRRFLIIGIAAYENSAAETSILYTRIADNTTTLIESLTDLREDQDDLVIQYSGTIICTGQVISLQVKRSSGDNFEFNGGSLSVTEIL